MKQLFFVLLGLSAITAFSGCATAISRNTEFSGRLYPAVTMDAAIVYLGASPDSIIKDGHPSLPVEICFRTCLVIGGIIDMPISIVTDTILIPLDLYLKRKKLEHAVGGDSVKAADGLH